MTRIAWVTGEPGMGRTALVRRFAADLGPDQVRWVSADESERMLRFGLVEQVLQVLGAGSDEGLGAGASELEVGARLVRALGAGSEPFALILDDLQWGDPPSLDALRFALRRLESEAVLIMVVSQSEPWAEIGDSWRRILEDPHRSHHCEVPGLTATEIIELAAAGRLGSLHPAAADRLREHTQGHPLHTIALLRELGGERMAAPEVVLPAPRPVADLVLAQIAALPEPARVLLHAGSVLGSSFSLAAAARLANQEDPVPAFEDAIGAGVLERVTTGVVQFSSAMVRGALYHDLGATHRRDLHRAAAEVVTDLESLLHRVDAAEGFDEGLGDQLQQAAEAESAAGNGTAASDLLRAAARMTAAPKLRERRMICAAEILLEHGQLRRARCLRPEIESCSPTPHRELVLGIMETRAGDFEAARIRFEAALSAPVVAEPDQPEGVGDVRSRLLATLAFVHWFLGDFELAFDAVDEALRGDVGWGAALSCYVRAMSLMQIGRAEELIENPAPAPLPEADRLAVQGVARFYLDDIPGAVDALSEAVLRGRKGTPTSLFMVALGMLAEAEFRQGRWDDAAIHAGLAVSLATDTDALVALIHASSTAAEIEAARGRFAASADHLDRLAPFVAFMPAWMAKIRAAMARAALAIAGDDATSLRAAAQILCSEPVRSQLEAVSAWRWRAITAEAHLAAGTLAEATQAVAELAASVHTHRQPSAAPDLARLTGWLAERQGRDRDALEAYTIDPETELQAHSPLAVARLSAARGELQVRLGDRHGGLRSLRAAHAAFAALGAVPFRDRCQSLLAAMDTGTPSAAALPALDLSPRQEAVAMLVADGMTNREIAAELYISLKGVEYHLGQIYSRLGLRSRRELRARMTGGAGLPGGQIATAAP